MQFFPSDILSAATGLSSGGMPLGQLGGAFSAVNPSAFTPGGSASGFKDVLDKLSAFNKGNTVGAVPLTTASTRDKSSFFNSEDFKALKDSLMEMGVSEDIINQYFTYMAATKNDPTIGDMQAAANELMEGVQFTSLTKQEFVQFNGLLSKLGFENYEIKEIEELMYQGNGLEIFKKIQEKLKVMAEEGKELEISTEELDILLKACNIQADMRELVIAALEGFELIEDDMLKLNLQSFDKLFSTTMAELEKRKLELQELQNNLGKAIEAMLDAKKLRPEEAVADMRGSALSARTETMAKVLATLINEEDGEEENSTSHLIDDKDTAKTVRKESIVAGMVDGKMSAKADKEAREADLKAGIRGDEKADPKAAAFAAASKAENKAEAAPRENAERPAADPALREDAPASSTQDKSEDKRGGNLFSGQQQSGAEADAGKAAFSSKVQEASGVVFSAFGQTENSASSANQANQSARAEMYNERIFDQIERGIVKNATDGSKQLVLRLDPPELGKLTLSITVAQGEVKAVIRTESTATTQVVSEQLAQLKQSLEEQGFKVSSLEVETRAQSHAGTDQWSGAEQHNQEQQVLEQARFLRLSRVRAKEGGTLAQSMQHVENTASISASGLHIIA